MDGDGGRGGCVSPGEMRKFMRLQDLTIGRNKAAPFLFSDLLHSTASMDLFDPLRSLEK